MGTKTDSTVTPSVSSAGEPALVVAFGATANKRRPIEKPSTLIGRNRCCDIRLESPEISGLHCLVSRDKSGWTIRDCDSKSGVIVNGHVIRETEIKDGDQIQIGPFSFVVSVPAHAKDASLEEGSLLQEELERKTEQEKCLQHHISSVEAERDRLASQLQDLRSEWNRSSNKIHELDAAYSEIDRLKTDLVDRERLSSELGQTLCSLEAFRRSERERTGRLAAELDDLRSTQVERTPAEETSSPVFEAWKEQAQAEAHELRERIYQLTKEKQQADQRFEELQSTNQSQEAIRTDDAVRLQEELEQKVHQLQSETDHLRGRIVELTEEKLAALDEAEQVRRAFEQTPPEQTPPEDSAEIASLREQLMQSQSHANSLETLVDQLRQELERSNESLRQLDAEQSAPQTDELAALLAERDQWLARGAQLEKERETFEALAKDYQSRAEWLEGELESFSAEKSRSKAEIESLRYAADVATRETSGLREHSRQLESEISTLRTEHVTLTQTQAFNLGGSKEKIAALEDELIQIRQELESREKQLLVAQQEKNKLRADLESGGASMIGELAQARAMIADLERELVQARSAGANSTDKAEEFESLRLQIADLERDASQQLTDNHRLSRELQEALAQAGRPSEGHSSSESDSGDVEQLRADWQAVEEARLDLVRRLDAEHEQTEQRLLAMRQQLEAERSQMKQLVMQAAADHDRTRSEMESLRAQLAMPAEERSPYEVGGGDQEVDYLRARVQELESALSSGQYPPREQNDLSEYEQQLEQYRTDLEQAQAELAQREQELETERMNLQDKLRQSELDLSRERASFAREKAELDRLKREFAAEMEHNERESTARARLAPLDRLASEVKGRAKEAPVIAPQPSLSDRLRSFMKRTAETPPKPESPPSSTP
ncbi:FHA domain-containing protein [bacterium]|nr:FHA domain-containing protein [bacterium]